jgi:tetratricopeptide (TPR) repeat protein
MNRHQRHKGSAAAWYRLGTLQLRQHRPDDAAVSFRQALAQEPVLAAAWHNLAHACQLMRQHDHALISYRRALQYCPNDPCSLNNLGVLLRELGRLDESLQVLGQLVSLYPDDSDGHWNLALSLLMTRRYPEGWQEYEWRFRRTLPVRVHDPGSPRWQGEPLEGKTILLCCEQAYGDSIQFVRFAAGLADWGATILLRCPDQSLAHLLAGAPGVSRTITPDEPLPPHDCWSPLLSLPLHLQTSQESIPACPYLFAPETTNQLEPSGTGIRIGLVWSGRSTDPQRACPVQLLEPLARFSGQVTFFSLQLNSTRHDLDLLQHLLGIIDLAPQLSDFQATAEIMQQLDLIISIDSAPAHLAGALGRETWLLLHQASDWRWGLQRSDSDWYPTMRFFRQPTGESWQPVIDQLVAALEQRLSSSAASIPVAVTDDLLALGDRLREQEQWSAAHHLYQLAAQRAPDNYRASLCAGGCLMFLNRPYEAATWFRQAIALNPKEADAHINLGMALLSSGNLQEGWREFEWRCCNITPQLPPIPALPVIPAGSRLDGTTVLIHAEQGLGDLLQFARYLPLLAATGARIIASVPAAMQRLIAGLAGVSQTISHGELLPEADYQLPLLSLPDRLSELMPDIPAQSPYLAPDPALQSAWQDQLADNGTLKLGLIWRGSNLGKSGYSRALTTELLRPLTGVEQTTCYSLQLGATSEELSQLPGVIDLSPQITDFADTAAIMANLDLIISVDTSTTHLAGALGVRCWVPLLFAPDWRWYPLQEPESRWYPSITAFRQQIPGQWEPVITTIAATLQGEALLHLGHRQGRAGNLSGAIAAFQQAAELPEKSATALLNLGIYLRAIGELTQACSALQQAVSAAPDYAEAWQNLGMVQQGLGRLPEAYTCLQHALRLRPDYETARWNLGLLQLLLGEYPAGFRNFESRFSKLGAVARLHPETPAWDGSPLTGRTILIHAEQGYGDTLQFVRFIPLLADQGANVILEVQDRSLAELCNSIDGIQLVVVRGEPIPAVDCQCPLLSLPGLLESTLATIPHKVPYLSADKRNVAIWQERLPQDSRHKIGICWKGRLTPDPFRSVPFEQLAALWELPGICWVSLQLDQDSSAQPSGMIDLTDRINSFADSAALISCLDLVISIDSAVAHLTGALGMPGVVMLPFAPDWRWTRDQQQTPWYPTLRLVRQDTPGNWTAVANQLIELLKGAIV